MKALVKLKILQHMTLTMTLNVLQCLLMYNELLHIC